MNLLLDTHIALWALTDDARLKSTANADGLLFLTHDRLLADYGESVRVV